MESGSPEAKFEETRTVFMQAVEALRAAALDGLARVDRDQALSDRIYGRALSMGAIEWTARDAACRLRGHRWQDVERPLTIKRWCDRCYEIEDAR